MSFWKEIMEEKEVTPDELLELYKSYSDYPGSLFVFVLGYLEPYMVKAILKTNADAIKKAAAIYVFGRLMSSFKALVFIYRFVLRHSQESFFKEEQKNLTLTAQKVTKRVIDLYSDVKKGTPLDLIIYWLVDLTTFELETSIEGFLSHLEIYLEKLKPS